MAKFKNVRKNAAKRLRNRHQAKTTHNFIKKLNDEGAKATSPLLNKVIAMLDRLTKKAVLRKSKTIAYPKVLSFEYSGGGAGFAKDLAREQSGEKPQNKQTIDRPKLNKVDSFQNPAKSRKEQIKGIDEMIESSSINIIVTHGEAKNERADLVHKFSVINRLITRGFKKGETIVSDEQKIIDQFNLLGAKEQQAEFERLKTAFYSIG